MGAGMGVVHACGHICRTGTAIRKLHTAAQRVAATDCRTLTTSVALDCSFSAALRAPRPFLPPMPVNSESSSPSPFFDSSFMPGAGASTSFFSGAAAFSVPKNWRR